MSGQLASMGGTPVRTAGWALWPQLGNETAAYLSEVLNNRRWAISWPNTGSDSFNLRFARAFAQFCNVDHCILAASGTASLSAALEALEVGPGDEVVVPGLTWVACASSVANLNATPILVDVDADTLCLSPKEVEKAITSRTKAILVVHLYSSVAQLDELSAISAKHGIPIVEDCAQAHGAQWKGQVVGGVGIVGTFSMQNGKVLTSGEGGAVVTRDASIARRVRQLVSDGRLFETKPAGQMELVECGEAQGNNACLSEFHAAVLLGQLESLPRQNLHRLQFATELDRTLSELGWKPQRSSIGTTQRTYYQYVASFDRQEYGGATAKQMAKALSAELNCAVAPIYPPLNANRLYQPSRRKRWLYSAGREEELAPSRFPLPVAEAAFSSSVAIPHGALLGAERDLQDMRNTFEKVKANAPEVCKIGPG